ncbi:MAG: hypothetical protein A2189_05500 [Paenibacillus sp. RIFOXYA1_FULL_44_5]|nr:MAG: hypothetical protein A2189_05500 [Paenibacillus sp. RIFOXYA1_FULL_44_5]
MGLETKEITAYLFMIILGLGMGLVMPTLMIAVQNEFPKSMLGAVTSASTFFRAIGGTIGITVLNVVMNHSLDQKMTAAIESAKVQDNPVLKAVFDKIGHDADKLFGILINPQALQKLPAQGVQDIVLLIKTAWTQSFSIVFYAGLIFIGAGVFVALTVGNGKIKREPAKHNGSGGQYDADDAAGSSSIQKKTEPAPE